MGLLFFVLVLIGFIFMSGMFLSIVRGLSQWNRSYFQLSKRYAGGKRETNGIMYGYFFSTPTLLFDYGRTFCELKSHRSIFSGKNKTTGLSMTWFDKKMKLEISAPPNGTPGRSRKIVPIESQFKENFSIFSNRPDDATKLFSTGVCWQLEQLRLIGNQPDLAVSIHKGVLRIRKNGYIKDYQTLDDFVRLSLQLFDQLMLTFAEGLNFVNSEEAVVCGDVKCPICSELIENEMVVCPRCKTPHCLDCWEYNGQCATFACHETRFTKVSNSSAKR